MSTASILASCWIKISLRTPKQVIPTIRHIPQSTLSRTWTKILLGTISGGYTIWSVGISWLVALRMLSEMSTRLWSTLAVSNSRPHTWPSNKRTSSKYIHTLSGPILPFKPIFLNNSTPWLKYVKKKQSHHLISANPVSSNACKKTTSGLTVPFISTLKLSKNVSTLSRTTTHSNQQVLAHHWL